MKIHAGKGLIINMNLGTNIKRLRNAQNLTQKDLADKLNVTAQAVSRWENNEVEPSLDVLKTISELFDVTLDELMTGNPSKKESEKPANNVTYITNNPPSSKPLIPIGVCEKCNKPIMEGETIHRHTTRIGRGSKTTHVYCSSCENIRQANIVKANIASARRGRIKGLGWGIPAGVIALAICLALAINQSFITGNLVGDIFISIGIAYAIFTLVFCSLADNNFVGDWFVSIASWGFVRMPGIIFGLDLEGIFWFLTVKLFLFILGITLALGAFFLAVVICGAIAVFVFPFSIRWTYTNPEKTDSL